MDLGSFEQGAAANPPPRPDAPSLGFPSGGDPLVGLAATTPGAYWFYQLQAELAALFESVNILPSDLSLTQLHDAIVQLAGGGLSFESVVGELRMNGTAALGSRGTVVRGDHVHPTDSTRAALASPTFTGVPAVSGSPPATGTATTQIATTAFVTTALAATAGVPAGTVAHFAGSSAPAGWLAANGQSVLRVGTYAALFTAIGTTYGYVDSTHFNVPDLRGEFIRGLDGGRGIDASRALGSAQKGTLVAIDLNGGSGGVVQGLTVGASIPGAAAQVAIGADAYSTGGYSTVKIVSVSSIVAMTSLPGVEYARWAGAARPRNVALLPIIKY